MKKILLLSFMFAGSLFMYQSAGAQFQADINAGININDQPAWGPSGYDYAENYYLPDVEAYYCVPRRQFVYFDRGNWVYASSLPGRYSNYDLYNGYKVVLNEHNPWFHFNDHRSLYAPYRYRHDQVMLRDYRGYARGGYGHPVYQDRRGGNGGYPRGEYGGGRGDRGRYHERGRW